MIPVPGFYLLVRDPLFPKVTHLRFERSISATENTRKEIAAEAGVQPRIIDTEGNIIAEGAPL